jgi:LysM repeat protein
VVRRGDTLSSIARRFNTTVAVLRRMNPEIRGDYLRVGQKVKVPPP